MILPVSRSRSQIVNLLSHYIVNKIDDTYTSIIEIADCGNFFVVKGKTDSNDILDLYSITSEFEEEFKEILNPKSIIKTIDLIEYVDNLPSLDKKLFKFYNTINPFFTKEQIELFNSGVSTDHSSELFEISNDSNFIISQYPYGYSINQGVDYLLSGMLLSVNYFKDHSNIDSIESTRLTISDELFNDKTTINNYLTNLLINPLK
jgi:hypothetical protein